MALIKETSEAIRIKPGQGRKLGTPRVVASSLPRTIRNRSPRRKAVKPGATGSPHAIVQEEITNAFTGKKAVGPWLGPFAPGANTPACTSNISTEGLIPMTIYMDNQGSCHLDLDPSDDKRLAQQLYKAQSDSGLLSEAADEAAARLASQQLVLRRETHMQARYVQAHNLFEHAALDKTPPARNMLRRQHVINQPRRFN